MRCTRCQQDNPETARFCNQCGAPLAATAAPELRRLTVMFCDLVGSVELASQLDPEDWHALLASYQSAAGNAVRRHHGHVAQHLGDGLVAYFGYPVAAEDDALRAVAAALDVVEHVGALRLPHSGARLRVRVGLHTGSTLMGHVGGSDAEYLALGDTPNIAARIQAIAPPNGVLLSPATRTLVEPRVQCVEFGEFALKGLPGALRLYQALAMRRGEDGDRGPARVSPFLGRERELQLLLQRWNESASAGRCVLVLGEPGIGKSRLSRELRNRLPRASSDAWVLRCSAHNANTPFAPLAHFLRQAMAVNGAPQPSSAALAGVLARVGVRDDATAAPLRALLALNGGAAPEEPGLSAQAMRERTFTAVTDVLRALPANRPTLVVAEDLHWADPSTLEWLGRVLAGGLPPGLLLLLLARTEFSPDWAHDPQVERLALEPCAAPDAAALVAALDPGSALAPDAVARIVERAEGNPLFVEEFTRSALEAQGESVPLTLQEQTMARLDRLGPAKQVLQQAAVVGRVFSRRLLQAASGLPEETLEAGLKRGVEVHMLRTLGEGSGTYAFRHALLRDAAYASLLRSVRQASHARVAEAILAQEPACARQQPELLAHHYTEAGAVQPAIAYWLGAARLALARSACVEAAAHARAALRLLGEGGETEGALAQELELRLVLAPALMAVRGVLDAEVEQAYARARVLCERLGNGPKLLVPLWGLWAYELMRGEIDRAQEVAGQLRSLAETAAAGQPLPALVAAATSGMTLLYRGELQAARTVLAEGLQQVRPAAAPVRSARGVHDPGVMCHAFHALACWLLGEHERAMAQAEALRGTIPSLPPFDAAYVWCSDAVLHTLAGDAAAACESAARGIAIGEEQAFPAWQTMGAMLQGWGRARQGDGASALAQMQRSYEAWCASGARNLRPLFLALLADAWLVQDDAAQALRCTEAGLAEAATGEHCWDPELHRLRAEALARRGQLGPAVESARRAVAAAQDMEARGWMQRANSSLERLLQRQATTG